MTNALGLSVAAVPHQVKREVAAVSCGTFPERKFDPLRYRAIYPDRWFQFLHSYFRSLNEVQYAFSVSERTARDWWEGKTTGQAWAVNYARDCLPGAEQLLKVA